MSTSESRITNLYVKAFAALLALLMVFAMVAGVFRLVKGEDESSDVSWLYSQTADSGTLLEHPDGTYRLVMDGVDFHTIQFSDRPDRLVEVIDTADFVHNWDTMFATSSPNAVLIEHEPQGTTDSVVVVLNNPHFDYENDEITYEATILEDELHPERLKKLVDAHLVPPTKMRAVSLFIDSVVSVGTNSGPIFTGPGADALKAKLGLSDIPTAPLELGNGVQVISANVSADTSTGKVAANAVIGFGNGSFQLNMSLEAVDSKNWTLSATTAASKLWSPAQVPGLVIDPSSFSGSISKTDGVLAFNLTSASRVWNVAKGAKYTSNLTFSSACPLSEDKCPANVNGPFISMDGTLVIAGFPNAISMKGAMTADAAWARFDGNAGNLTFEDTGVTNATLTIWRGSRTDSFDPNMELPSLAKLTNGNNAEFCGGLTLTVPGLGNKATNGCVRWSPKGVVIGQISIANALSGTMSSTGATATSSTNVKGLSWTNISPETLGQLPSADVVMSGVSATLKNRSITLAGTTTMPNVLAKALNITLLKNSSLTVDVSGQLSMEGFTLTGDIDTKILLGRDPFKLAIRKMTATISKLNGGELSISVGTQGQATVGYSPNTRTLNTSVSVVAGPSSGMALSVNVVGSQSSADAANDGLTVATRLTDPGNAEFVWPDQFGIKGLNLWNLTVQIAYSNGSPSLSYASTSYIDPNGSDTKKVLKCNGPCDASDWMVGTFGITASYTDPCFAYSFNSGSGKSSFQLDGGIMTATSFGVGIAPTGCSIQSGGTVQSLPVGYMGFQFAGSFGDTTVDVATQLKNGAFVFNFEIDNLKLAGVKYTTVKLNVKIDDSGSDVSFTADLSTKMGSLGVTAGFTSGSSGLAQTVEATLSDWKWSKEDTIDLTYFHFKTSTTLPTDGSCADFNTDADGKILVGSQSLTLEEANFHISCNTIENLAFKVNYAHTPKFKGAGTINSYISFQYPTIFLGKKYFAGSAGFSYNRDVSRKYGDKYFDRSVSVSFDMSISVYPGNPSTANWSFSGEFDADRVSGDISGTMDEGNGDFTCKGEMRLNPSWAGVYHYTWDDL